MLGLTRRGVGGGDLESVRPVADADQLRAARAQVDATAVGEDVARYVVAVVRRTRDLPRVTLGASPRAGLLLLRAAKAHALLRGRDHAIPDDVQLMGEAVLAHRIVLAPDAYETTGEQVVADAVATTPAL